MDKNLEDHELRGTNRVTRLDKNYTRMPKASSAEK